MEHKTPAIKYPRINPGRLFYIVVFYKQPCKRLIQKSPRPKPGGIKITILQLTTHHSWYILFYINVAQLKNCIVCRIYSYKNIDLSYTHVYKTPCPHVWGPVSRWGCQREVWLIGNCRIKNNRYACFVKLSRLSARLLGFWAPLA